MGEKNNVMNHYFCDRRRFADLFNGVYFQGESAIKMEELTEISGVYYELEAGRGASAKDQHASQNVSSDQENSSRVGSTKKKRIRRTERIRDLQMSSKEGEIFRLLALENQQLVNYAMPFRCMEYDTLEYGRQIEDLRKRNSAAGDYGTAAEWIGGIKKSDRLMPVYTLCLYHGEEVWDGPRSLKDMMNFGSDRDGMSRYFADYPLQLYCLNEQTDYGVFRTEIRQLFQLLRFCGDRRRLRQELEENTEYQNMDEDTLEAAAAMLDLPQIWKERENYRSSKEGGYDMCTAVREWREELLAEGKAEGKAEAILDLLDDLGTVPEKVKNLVYGQTDLNILRDWHKKAARANCLEEFENYLTL